MSCFSLCVEEAGLRRVHIKFRVSGLQKPFTKNNYEEIILTTNKLNEGTTTYAQENLCMTYRCGLEEGQSANTYTGWTYDSTANNIAAEITDYGREMFSMGKNLTIYAYARVTESETYWLIGKPITFTVASPNVYIDRADNGNTYLYVNLGYMIMNNSNFSYIGYNKNTGEGVKWGTIDENKSFLTARYRLNYDNGTKITVDAYVWTKDGEQYRENSDNDYWPGGSGRVHCLTENGYRWHIGRTVYSNEDKMDISNIVVIPVDEGLSISWAPFKDAKGYAVRAYDETGENVCCWETEENTLCAWRESDWCCRTYKISVQAYRGNEGISANTFASGVYTIPPPQPFINIDIKGKWTIEHLRAGTAHSEWPDDKTVLLWLKLMRGNDVIWELEGGARLNGPGAIVYLENLNLEQYGNSGYIIYARTEYTEKGLYCLDENGNDYRAEYRFELPKKEPDNWDWYRDEETMSALACTNPGQPTERFNYRVWNDIADKCKEWLIYYEKHNYIVPNAVVNACGLEGTFTYAEMLDKAKMVYEDRILYAYKFNILRMSAMLLDDEYISTKTFEAVPKEIVRMQDIWHICNVL